MKSCDKTMTIVGLMSGTSLDGVDLACCRFEMVDNQITYTVLAAETLAYPDEWVDRLANLEHSSALDYVKANVELGHYYGLIIRDFIKANVLSVDAVASHGHTIFHQPQFGLTAQVGDIDAIAAETGLTVVGNFRALDVALGGQGAPLVPIGDKLLFANYEARLNLGGIANISFADTAFDICPCNMALNNLSQRIGYKYDSYGDMARKGSLLMTVLGGMNDLEYYRRHAPKSLGKEWFTAEFAPLLSDGLPTHDLLRTTVEHIATQIANVVNANNLRTMLITGGGAKNDYLIERLRILTPDCEVAVPDALVVDFKEAIVFALLGFLRLRGCSNCLSSVTGAKSNCCGGDIAGLCNTIY